MLDLDWSLVKCDLNVVTHIVLTQRQCIIKQNNKLIIFMETTKAYSKRDLRSSVKNYHNISSV